MAVLHLTGQRRQAGKPVTGVCTFAVCSARVTEKQRSQRPRRGCSRSLAQAVIPSAAEESRKRLLSKPGWSVQHSLLCALLARRSFVACSSSNRLIPSEGRARVCSNDRYALRCRDSSAPQTPLGMTATGPLDNTGQQLTALSEVDAWHRNRGIHKCINSSDRLESLSHAARESFHMLGRDSDRVHPKGIVGFRAMRRKRRRR